ncbi:DNA cytosine methyltransferase [Gloeocapsa sp. PCC 73106]|uniref:DNA cytosine methyltransferase n=1 Tax=Gloeocapsa sp. PCC 73106 TaxID=102232 RepID=UPI0002ACFCAD|nr:DNA cytosine methyltransferase [Gloeocapsa sp. PCC 73106]ELR97485.1 DNA-methyltransferase Dcm [Gloeocapsa sp. PCC 73106]
MLVNSQRRPIAVDLFAGAGGMSLGFERAGFDVLAAVEVDPIHCATYQYNFPVGKVICQDASQIKATDIRRLSPLNNQPVDVVFGGPPCQGLSLMGKRDLDDPRNSLLQHFIRLVIELETNFFVLENVPGLIIGKCSQLLQEMIEQLAQNGYKVRENFQTINACNYGVPQKRERLFLMGCKKNLPLPEYPSPLADQPKVNDAIADLPSVTDYPILWQRDSAIVEYGKASPYSAQLRGLLTVEDDYSYKRLYDKSLLTSSLLTKHSATCQERFALTLPGKVEPISRFYKLSPEGLCNTLRAGTNSDRGSYTSPRPIHPWEARCITVREAARLHSYPDWFRFHVTKWHGFRQVGNSVPPRLAQAIAREIMVTLQIQPRQSLAVYSLGEPKLLTLNPTQATQYYRKDL